MINIRSFRISYKLEVLNAFTFSIYKNAKVHNVRLTALFKNTQTLKFRSRLYRPFPSSKKSHFQNEAKCETFVVKMSFICIIIKNHFHINGFALSLALKVRFLELGNGLKRSSLPSILVPRARRFLVTWSLQLSQWLKDDNDCRQS